MYADLLLEWTSQSTVLCRTVTSISSLLCMLFTLPFTSLHQGNESTALSSSSLFLQVCHLRNTKYMLSLSMRIMVSLAACVYTGNETKFGMNKNVPQMKLTHSDRMINWFTVAIFCFQVIACWVVKSSCAWRFFLVFAAFGMLWVFKGGTLKTMPRGVGRRRSWFPCVLFSWIVRWSPFH